MALAQSGDREAYRALLEDISAMLRGFLRRKLADPEDAADVLQEILMTLHRSRHTYDAARPFEPWLFAVVRNVMIDHARRRARTARVEVLAVDELPEAVAPEPVSSSDLLEDALRRLPAAQREAFEMIQMEGLSVAAAAERAGTSMGALRVRAHRAYKAIRERLVKS
jgi:RNA polymerase sigma-70 factor (ECF subfamily)